MQPGPDVDVAPGLDIYVEHVPHSSSCKHHMSMIKKIIKAAVVTDGTGLNTFFYCSKQLTTIYEAGVKEAVTQHNTTQHSVSGSKQSQTLTKTKW